MDHFRFGGSLCVQGLISRDIVPKSHGAVERIGRIKVDERSIFLTAIYPRGLMRYPEPTSSREISWLMRAEASALHAASRLNL